MADEQGGASPLELFNSIAAQGERVRALKAGQAAKVGAFAGLFPQVHQSLLDCVPRALTVLPVTDYNYIGYHLTFVFSFINIIDALEAQ